MTSIPNNQKNSAFLTGIICAITLFGFFAQANAQEGATPVQKAVQTFLGNILKYNSDFKMTDEQKEQATAVLNTHKAEIQAEMKRSKLARQAFNKEAKADINSQATKDAAAIIGESAASGAILRAKIFAEMSEILTEEQQATALSAGKEVENLIANLFGMVKE